MFITKVQATHAKVTEALGATSALDLSGAKNLIFNGSKLSYRGGGWWVVSAYTKDKQDEAVKFLKYMGGKNEIS